VTHLSVAVHGGRVHGDEDGTAGIHRQLHSCNKKEESPVNKLSQGDSTYLTLGRPVDIVSEVKNNIYFHRQFRASLPAYTGRISS